MFRFFEQKCVNAQNCYKISNKILTETLNRELRPLKEIDDNYPKYILSMDLGNEDMNGIKRQNVLDWLMEFKM